MVWLRLAVELGGIEDGEERVGVIVFNVLNTNPERDILKPDCNGNELNI